MKTNPRKTSSMKYLGKVNITELAQAVSEITEAVSNKKKVKWDRLVQLGLPLVLGLL